SACSTGCSNRRVSPGWRASISSCARATTPRAASTVQWASTRRCSSPATTAAAKAARKARCACCASCARRDRCRTPGGPRRPKTTPSHLRNDRKAEAQLRFVLHVVVQDVLAVAGKELHVQVRADRAELEVAS